MKRKNRKDEEIKKDICHRKQKTYSKNLKANPKSIERYMKMNENTNRSQRETKPSENVIKNYMNQ